MINYKFEIFGNLSLPANQKNETVFDFKKNYSKISKACCARYQSHLRRKLFLAVISLKMQRMAQGGLNSLRFENQQSEEIGADLASEQGKYSGERKDGTKISGRSVHLRMQSL